MLQEHYKMKKKATYTVTDKLITKITAWIAGAISLALMIWGIITVFDLYRYEKTNEAGYLNIN